MDHGASSSGSTARALLAIGMLIVIYGLLAMLGFPQDWANTANFHEDEHELETHHPPLWMVVPFALLLLIIAVFPMIPKLSHWWEDNRHKFLVGAVLAASILPYYFFAVDFKIEGHWPGHHYAYPSLHGPNTELTVEVLANALMADYIPFITLLFTLYTISGGIRIEGDLRARPLVNTVFLAIGGLLASFIGTTGAAMLLVRALLDTNRERRHVTHTVVFFIFIVCNCGGCLLPIGDPPLFLGYLHGVPFLWTLQLWKEWLFVNGVLLVFYYLWDRFYFYPRETPSDIRRDETIVRPLRIRGLWPNLPLLLGVVLSVGMLDPSMDFLATGWHPWMLLREMVQLCLVAVSLLLSSRAVRQANRFNYVAIAEVAALFFGIFITMQPALQILKAKGGELGLSKPWHFFWATGSLSSVLDNAPTYLVFFQTAQALSHDQGDGPAGIDQLLLVAVSLGAVFMGANTYIGNGPNFMVKTIAERSGVPMPSFFGYMLYSGCILLPLFVLVTLIFLL